MSPRNLFEQGFDLDQWGRELEGFMIKKKINLKILQMKGCVDHNSSQ